LGIDFVFYGSMKATRSVINTMVYVLVLVNSVSCTQKETDTKGTQTSANFILVSPQESGITFQNKLEEGPNTNILMYEYFYNGGGVAAGDFNGDGLIDLYFTSNMGENKMYLNSGHLTFKDITQSSGTGGRPGPWKTGAAAVDINGDHRLDLYVSYSGALPPEKRANQLFINKGNDADNAPVFEESAPGYGLASQAYSNQAYFFDYDRDQDLDLLLLNHNPKSLPVLNERSTEEFLKVDDPLKGVRLYRQDPDKFTDVTTSSGISGSALTYGLGIGISDLNDDGWPDFYLSNDYAVPDYLYINNRNGTFTDRLSESFGHISHFSMGNDIADINNDGRPDIYTLDMLPEDNHRQKLLLSPDNYEKFDLNIRSGFHYQYMRNMLQLNIGNGTYQEIGQLAGVSNTDWSWAALLADFDNDGWKDIFVTNGYYRDYTNLDFINYMNNYTEAKGRLTRNDVLEIIESMPSSNVTNYLFVNQNGQRFSNGTRTWGLDHAGNSNGACFADLDNDGDLEIVVNNINQPAFIYDNQSVQLNNHSYLQVTLKGDGKNTMGLGAKVVVYHNGTTQMLEQSTSRGYLSSISPVLNFGLGSCQELDSITITWNSGKRQTLYSVRANQMIELSESDASMVDLRINKPGMTVFSPGTSINYTNPVLSINDFKRQSLLICQLSYSGPAITSHDINSDGLTDLVVGGAQDQGAVVFIQQADHNFIKTAQTELDQHAEYIDTGLKVFDANGDGAPDLYAGSGGYHLLEPEDRLLQDRLYLNDGNGRYTFSQGLPKMLTSTSCVAVNDIDGDDDPDLFVGGRLIPGRYPETPRSYLLVNDGKGNYRDATDELAPQLSQSGMVTDAKWADLNGDSVKELIIVGEWMPVTVFGHVNGKWEDQSSQYFSRPYSGWWNSVMVEDLDLDGQPELIAGNMGTNTQFQVSEKEPAEMYFDDFDQNGSVDPIFCYYIQGKSYPYVTRDELLRQLVSLRSRFTNYESFASATMQDIFISEQLQSAKKLTANHMETTLFRLNEDGKFEPAELPVQAQYAPVYCILVDDFTGDGHQDVLLLGNNHHLKLRLGKSDANNGCLLAGDGSGRFEYVDQLTSGLNVQGVVRSAVLANDLVILGINQGPVLAYKWK